MNSITNTDQTDMSHTFGNKIEGLLDELADPIEIVCQSSNKGEYAMLLLKNMPRK